MEIDVNSIINPNTTESNSSSSLSKLSSDLDSFLTILTTQLQFQDPLEPLESSEFTNQLVLFAQVEQDIQQNKNLEQMVSLQQDNIAVGALSFMNKSVDVAWPVTELRNGEASFSYIMTKDAASATLSILGENGERVRTETAELTEGRHDFVWDGKDDNGNALKDGVYIIQVNAQDANNQPVEVGYSTFGTVTGVTLDRGSAILEIGDVQVPLGNVTRIREPGGEGTGDASDGSEDETTEDASS